MIQIHVHVHIGNDNLRRDVTLEIPLGTYQDQLLSNADWWMIHSNSTLLYMQCTHVDVHVHVHLQNVHIHVDKHVADITCMYMCKSFNTHCITLKWPNCICMTRHAHTCTCTYTCTCTCTCSTRLAIAMQISVSLETPKPFYTCTCTSYLHCWVRLHSNLCHHTLDNVFTVFELWKMDQ